MAPPAISAGRIILIPPLHGFGRCDGARVFKYRRVATDAYGVACDRVQCAGVKVGAERRIVVVKNVFTKP
jgi:hypothetical protein